MLVSHLDIVYALHAQHPPLRTVEGALAFVVMLLADLPRAERAGLLHKDQGENIVDFQGVMVSAGRICYPDGQVYKVLTDVPATNGPEWLDDGTVDPARYVAVTTPGPPSAPAPAPPPPDDDRAAQLERLLEAGDRIVAGLAAVVETVTALNTRLDRLQLNGVRVHL